MERYVIGLDSGTSSIKAVVFDELGRELYKKGFHLTPICPREDQFEEDEREIWFNAQEAIREAASHFPAGSIRGIGITAQGDGLWMLDEDGRPVRNGCCFCDGRASEFVDQWVQDGTCDRLFEQTGTRIFTGNQNGIVKWMERYEPDALARSRWLMHLKDVLFYRLTGKITTDATDQSLIFLNQNTRQYDPQAFALCGLENYMEKYPPVVSAAENYAKLRPELAHSLGLSEEVVVTSGPMDVAACALGSGVIEPGECCSIIGTAALHEMVVDRPLADNIRAGMTVSHMMEGRWLRLMASLAGTPNLDWVLDQFGTDLRRTARENGESVYDLVERIVEKVPIGAHGVMYHPYLLAGGERAPFTDARARASFTNLNVTHTLSDILRATYEGVAFAMLDCYLSMPSQPKKITVCGGGSESRLWCQMFADVLGTEICTVDGGELGARGAALNNLVVQGVYSDYAQAVAKMVKSGRCYQPDFEKHAAYARLYPLYTSTRKALQSVWKLRQDLEKQAEEK